MRKFEEWYLKSDTKMSYNSFNSLPLSMRYGLYLEYFDSLGLIVTIEQKDNLFELWTNKETARVGYFSERTQAQQQGVNKAFKLLA